MPLKLLLCNTADGLAQLQYALLKSSSDMESEAVTDGFRAVDVAARIQPDVVVVEAAGLADLSGAELIRRLTATVPETRVICWTSLDSPFTAAEMIAAGASAYLLKSDGPQVVVRAMSSVLDGNVGICPRVADLLAEGFADPARACRELDTGAIHDTEPGQGGTRSAKAEFLANVSTSSVPHHGGQGHRLRASQSFRLRGRARGVPGQAERLAGEADDDRRRDADDRRARARDALPEAHRG